MKKYEKKGKPDRCYSQAFCAMLEDLDRSVGILLKALDSMGISKNTYVFFMSDNGATKRIPDKSKKGGKPTNYPLSGAKQSLNEGGIRVPFIVRGPGIKPGSSSHVPVVGYDLLPTFYSLAGGRTNLPEEIDGGTIKSLFTGGKGSVARSLDALVFHRPRNKVSAIRDDRYKLLVEWSGKGEVASRMLYDMQSDPNEKKNTASAHSAMADALQKKLVTYLKSVNANMPGSSGKKNRSRKK
jgi:arylsulfatase A-like enzyme